MKSKMKRTLAVFLTMLMLLTSNSSVLSVMADAAGSGTETSASSSAAEDTTDNGAATPTVSPSDGPVTDPVKMCIRDRLQLQFIRICVVHHTVFVFHTVAFFFYIRKNPFRNLRIHTFQIFKIHSLNPLVIKRKGHRISHIIRQFFVHRTHSRTDIICVLYVHSPKM